MSIVKLRLLREERAELRVSEFWSKRFVSRGIKATP